LKAYCEGGQGPPRAVAPPKKKKKKISICVIELNAQLQCLVVKVN